MAITGRLFWLTASLCFCIPAFVFAQHHGQTIPGRQSPQSGIAAQPFLAQALRLKEALSFLGSSLSATDEKRLEALQHQPHTPDIIKQVQDILDPYCLAAVHINPEGRVKAESGLAKAKLMQGGWTSFLIKVYNEAGATSQIEVQSPNALKPQHSFSFDSRVLPENVITAGEVANRFMDIQMYRNRPLLPHLSGLQLEYAVVQLYSKDAGLREVELGFNAGQGSQDIGFRNTISILFEISPAVTVIFDVKDENGTPVMASFVITDSINRSPGKLSGVYPLPSRRVAAYDEYPDFFFQPQIYRKNGEHVQLPPGKYHITYTRGPEYIPQTKTVVVPQGVDTMKLSFTLRRWINMSRLGWYSADHHVHAAGCSHYDSPEEGVRPADMWRQALGEDLNVASVLTWGPSWYHQKSFFTGKDDPLSTQKNIMRYDVEVSGFPSSHAGHLVLLGLKEDDYPGTTQIEEWPSWTLPVLTWARLQGAVAGYAHSGWGLAPMQPTSELPNYIVPKMDYIGANEYIVTAALNAVDFYSAGDTPLPWELNMWYHTLNCGFKIPLSGETDFPCITDERIGQARTYFKAEKEPVNYDNFVEAIKKGNNYVSEGGSHIINFKVDGVETKNNEVSLKQQQMINITADVAAWLPEQQPSLFTGIEKRPFTETPYWHIERARIGKSRKVRVELVVNGRAVDTTEITADGQINRVSFASRITRSVWVALRIYASAHTNPIFIIVNEKPVAEAKSAQWCIQALDQCWEKKEPNIRPKEKPPARAAYDRARKVYENIVKEIGASKN